MPAAQAAAELAKHVPQITMHPADQNGDRNYVCQGDWNLRGNLTHHGHVLMVVGVDLSPRRLGYEPSEYSLVSPDSAPILHGWCAKLWSGLRRDRVAVIGFATARKCAKAD